MRRAKDFLERKIMDNRRYSLRDDDSLSRIFIVMTDNLSNLIENYFVRF